MNLDLRLPIGLMFTIFGILLTVFGLVSDNAIYARSLDVNVNLWWGLVLLVFGLVMLGFAHRGRAGRSLRRKTDEGGHVLRGWLALVPALLCAGLACARGGGEDEPAPDDSPVRVEVTNDNALPVEIYAVGSGISHRMGTVHPGMASHFVIPQNLVGSGAVELQARTGTAGQPFRSGQLLLAPGTIVDLVIARQLFNSTATLRQ
jgi:hypothetical protein